MPPVRELNLLVKLVTLQLDQYQDGHGVGEGVIGLVGVGLGVVVGHGAMHTMVHPGLAAAAALLSGMLCFLPATPSLK